MGSVKKIPPIIARLVLLLDTTSGDDYVLFAHDLKTGKVKFCMRVFCTLRDMEAMIGSNLFYCLSVMHSMTLMDVKVPQELVEKHWEGV